METLPDINSVYQRVIREESRIGASRPEPKEAPVGFNATVGEEQTSGAVMAAMARDRRSIVCSHCGRTGHEKKECWQLVGFPEWFNERGGRGGRGRGRGRGNNLKGNAVQAATASAGSNQSSGVPPFSAEQWASLASLLERQKQAPIPDKLNGPFYEDSDWSR
ncbi:uncharacterized protein LOC130512633 [Raphanus sativus]|uniref:Uncharacterized protein LOC130512633 n=1 Tax=Raphanus sativus TaxID=3726 RepID=A0A9W3DSB8_RAPSA|nr:uncharacterized protein LOC130512633 [Raphanus sativus]